MCSFRKEAKQALDEKDYNRALIVCEYGLEVERDDYLLLVFRGVALKNLEDFKQAIRSYEKATLKSPDQLLAWKGLLDVLGKVSMHEKKSEMLEKTLFNLRRLSSEPEKKTLWIQYIDYLQCEKRFKETIKELEEFSSVYDEDVIDRLVLLWELWEDEEIKERIEKERFRVSADLINVTTRKVSAQVYSESALTDLLVKNEDDWNRIYSRLDLHCPEKYSELFENLTEELKVSNSIAAKRFLDRLDVENLEEYPSDVLLFLNDAYCEYALGDKGRLTCATGLFQTFVYCWYLTDTLQFAEGIKTISTVLSKFNQKRNLTLRKLLAKCNYETKAYSECVSILESIEQIKEYLDLLTSSYDRLEMHEKAAKLLPAGSKERAWQLFKAKMYVELAKELDAISERDGEYLVLKGLAQWHCGKEDERHTCLDLWKQALAEDDDQFALAHYYSGMYYAAADKLTLASLSLEKAVKLDAELKLALELAQVYLKQGRWMETFALMKKYQGKRSWRRFFYMGIAIEEVGEYGEAVVYFQEALKETGVPAVDVLRHLAVCFSRHGSWKAAMRAYKKLENMGRMCLQTRLGLFELYLREEERLLDAYELLPKGNRVIGLYCLRRLIKTALDAFDYELLAKLKEKSFQVDSTWNAEELYLLSLCVRMLPLEIRLSGDVLDSLPRSVSKNPCLVLEYLSHDYNHLLIFDKKNEDEVTHLLNEAIREDSLEKYERVCVLDPSQGLAWMGRYLKTKDSSFLFCALEWLKDVNWIEFALKEIRRRKINVENEEVLIMALERLCCHFKIEDSTKASWAFKWLGKLFERNALLEEALEVFASCDDKTNAQRVKVLLGVENGDMQNPMNKLCDSFQREAAEMDALLSQIPSSETVLFNFSLQVLSDVKSDSSLDVVVKEKHPYRKWQAIKLLYLANEQDPSIIIEHFKECTGLLSLRIAQDILDCFPEDEVLKEAIKERKHTWQDIYEGERPCPRIGRQLYKKVTSR